MSVAKPKLAYTLDEAAEATGQSKDVLGNLHREGLLPYRYVTSKPVILHADLMALLENAATESPAERRRAS
jgi:hypothetical protein